MAHRGLVRGFLGWGWVFAFIEVGEGLKPMKTILEPEDIQAIVLGTIEGLKPFLIKKSSRDDDEAIYDVKWLCKYLGVDESWVYKQVSGKNIPHYKIGKYVRFRRSTIDKWLESQKVMPLLPGRSKTLRAV